MPDISALEALVRRGTPSVEAFREAIADDDVFLGCVGGIVLLSMSREPHGPPLLSESVRTVVRPLFLGAVPFPGSEEFLNALRDRYQTWTDANRSHPRGPHQGRNPLQIRALGKAEEDATVHAIHKLTVLGDFSLLETLRTARDRHARWADQDTGEGTYTSRQVYGAFIQAVDRIIEQRDLES